MNIPNDRGPLPGGRDAFADGWTLAGRKLVSRLILGTGGLQQPDLLRGVIAASGTELATAAMRRVGTASGKGSLLGALREAGAEVLPTTPGRHTASDALLVARLARAAPGQV